MTTKDQPLFRMEPLLARSTRECSAFQRSATTHSMLIYAICLVVVAGAAFASEAKLSRKATITGRIELADGELKLYSDQRRLVSKLMVKEGDRVRKGTPLALLRRQDDIEETTASGESGNGYALIRASMAREAQRLKQATVAAQKEYEISKANLQSRLQNINLAVTNQKQELESLQHLRELSEHQHSRGKTLKHKKHLSLLDLERLEERQTQRELEVSAGIGQMLSLRERLASTRHELQAIEHRYQRQLREIGSAIEENLQQKTRLDMNIELILKAPADGVVTGLLTHAGATVEANRPVITMAKDNATFRARLWATSRSAGEIEPGQKINLMLDAFPHQKHGMLHAELAHINESPLSSSELATPGPGNKLNYSITADIATTSPLYPKLKAGMTLIADIKLDNSGLAERLFEPLTSAWKRSF